MSEKKIKYKKKSLLSGVAKEEKTIDKKATSHEMNEDETLSYLYKCYEIEPKSRGAQKKLIINLTKQYVPDIKIVENQRKSGRPSKWKGFDGLIFYTKVQKKIREKKCTVKNAITILQKKEYSDYSVSTLNTRYYETEKNPLVVYINQLNDEKKFAVIDNLTS